MCNSSFLFSITDSSTLRQLCTAPFFCHTGGYPDNLKGTRGHASRNTGNYWKYWIPAFAGMTDYFVMPECPCRASMFFSWIPAWKMREWQSPGFPPGNCGNDRGGAGMTEVEAGTRDLKGYDKIVGFVWLCKRLLSVRTLREANPCGVSVRKTSWDLCTTQPVMIFRIHSVP